MKLRIFLMITLTFMVSASLFAFIKVTIATAERNESVVSTIHLAPSGTVSGGGYQLEIINRPISIADSKYLLRGPAAPTLNGNGCCCNFLPCMVKVP